MRYKAPIRGHARYHKALIYAREGQGVYLFLFDTPANRPCCADEWYLTLDDAFDAAAHAYGIQPADWAPIPAPLPGQQHDLEYPPEAAS